MQGKGEFTMEYKEHAPVSGDVQTQLVNTYKASKESWKDGVPLKLLQLHPV